MARKSRFVSVCEEEIVFRAGIYARLSVEDGDDIEQNSVGNQKRLCSEYLQKHNIALEKVYTDHGYSGMLAQRPALQEMLSDAENGAINCIIVKDISRLRRNFIATAELVEKILPRLKIRLICINDGYDSIDRNSDALKGKVFCGDCGSRMHQRKACARKNATTSSRIFYDCGSYKSANGSRCSCHYISQENILRAIHSTLQTQLSLCTDKLQALFSTQMQLQEKTQAARQQEIQRQVQNWEDKKRRLFEDYAEGLLDREEFLMQRQKYDDKLQQLKSKSEQEDLQKIKTAVEETEQWLKQLQSWSGQPTEAQLDALVEKIQVFSDKRIQLHLRFRNPFEVIDHAG